LLENYSPALVEVVKKHPSLKTTEVDALAQFEQLYMEFLQPEKMEPTKFQEIVVAIPYCDFNEFHWKFKAEQNVHLESVLNHSKRKNK